MVVTEIILANCNGNVSTRKQHSFYLCTVVILSFDNMIVSQENSYFRFVKLLHAFVQHIDFTLV